MATATKSKVATRVVAIELPEDLLAAAEARGIHLANVFARAVSERIASYDEFRQMIDALHAVQPPITQEEIDVEIAAWKAEKAAKRERADRC